MKWLIMALLAALLAAPAATAAPRQQASLNGRVSALERQNRRQAVAINVLTQQVAALKSQQTKDETAISFTLDFAVCGFKIDTDAINQIISALTGQPPAPPIDDKGACARIGVGTKSIASAGERVRHLRPVSMNLNAIPFWHTFHEHR